MYTGSQKDLINVGLKIINIIVTLVNKLLFNGFNIFINNFYLLILTFHYIYNMKYNVIGIIHLNKISNNLSMKKLVIKKIIK
jgi:hypothetical protein